MISNTLQTVQREVGSYVESMLEPEFACLSTVDSEGSECVVLRSQNVYQVSSFLQQSSSYHRETKLSIQSRRTPNGHRMDTRWTPDKARYLNATGKILFCNCNKGNMYKSVAERSGTNVV